MEKPQYQFKDLVDNSTQPWVPKLKVKMFSTHPIPQSILDAQRSPSEYFKDWEEVGVSIYSDLVMFT